MSVVVGIDAGGTKLAAGRVDTETGKVSDRRVVSTGAGRGGDAVLLDCVNLGRALRVDGSTVGIGVPEIVDATGRIQSAANWDWRATDVAGAFENIAPVRIVSDVFAAALAEARFGAGRDSSSFFYVTVGTGISSTLVVRGEPWAGADGRAIILGAPLVEDVASGPAIARAAGTKTAEQAFAETAGDTAIATGAEALGLEIARIVHATDPGLIVLGGGLGLNERYRELITQAIHAAIDTTYALVPAVVAATLGTDAGIIGAALAASSTTREQSPPTLHPLVLPRP